MLRYFCVTFAILAGVVAVTEDEIQSLHAYMRVTSDKCMEKFGVTMEKLQEMKEAKTLDSLDPCLAACALKENKIIDSKGMFDKGAGHAIAEKFIKSPDDLKNIEKVEDICSAVNEEKVGDGDKGCERAVLLIQCFIDNKDTIMK